MLLNNAIFSFLAQKLGIMRLFKVYFKEFNKMVYALRSINNRRLDKK